MAQLRETTATQVITHIKSFFARHGIPDVFITDNGPQFSCAEFHKFAKTFEFSHVTSSPRYPQSNGLIENGVKIVKLLLKKAMDSKTDPYLALLNYRSTPLSHGLSPAELLFNRKLRTHMPQLLERESVQKRNIVMDKQKAKNAQKRYYDRGSKELKELKPNDRVRLHDGKHWSLEAQVLQNVAPSKCKYSKFLTTIKARKVGHTVRKVN
uniref:Integrase catalytic domain-containing protein n=1 Tax=Pygocentrus nattereri TaxID=42514 RepID=A0AAR2K7E9_PYGNA